MNRPSTPAQALLPRELHTADDISRLVPAFARALTREFDLASLAGRLCPVLLESGDAAIFAVREYIQGDPIDEVERLVLSLIHI